MSVGRKTLDGVLVNGKKIQDPEILFLYSSPHVSELCKQKHTMYPKPKPTRPQLGLSTWEPAADPEIPNYLIAQDDG